MAQSIKIAGASYPNVPAINVQKTAGGTAVFVDTSDATATAGDITTGKSAYVGGMKLVGSNAGGGNYVAADGIQAGGNCNTFYDAEMASIQNGLNCPSGSAYGAILTLPYRKASGNATPDFSGQIFLPNGDDATNPNEMFYRTSLGGSWNAWMRLAGIVESGSDDRWKWTKYADGSMELEGVILTSNGIAVTTKSGYVYCSAQLRLTFPVSFAAQPAVALTAGDSGILWSGGVVSAQGSVNYKLISTISRTVAAGARISVIANGRWK